jgi:epsilon-lactone hydrolase
MGHTSMPSLRGSLLRSLLRIRKAAIDWDMPVEKLRAMQKWGDRLVKLPRGIEIKPAPNAPVAMEWIVPDVPLQQGMILYVHGGGWTLGMHNHERRMLARMCQATNVCALAVDYRLAPEQPFPGALEDCVAAYRWLSHAGTSARNIVVVGTSAGGNLIVAMLMSLRDAGDPLPAAAVGISPMIDLAGTGESFRVDKDPAHSVRFVLAMARHYAGGQDARLPLLSPFYGDLRGLPPLLIQVGGDEILLSDATRLRDSARRAGVDARLVVWPGMWHGWHLFGRYLPEAEQAVNDISAFVRERLNLA